ncbi:hypothetical protein BCR36DRAFT_355730 [Piromyces finnis]|uniref:Uncharacterized protein n=1 Tax=Piromyces finnis TaxID=1754191 RepID=A0A1Y1V7A2_9FUNG|nr:hypothetical protein BCR36DRAFT_355730 [Piromyces finnis]|eukprot:ORX47647.1 hypothetical protein BCR36DRAFT_355730 [Piromyces finnis]
MESLISCIETNKKTTFPYGPINSYQLMPVSYIKSLFFAWTFLVIIMNRNNWKRPVLILLIVHWIFRSTGDCLNQFMYLLIKDPTFKINKLNEKAYMIGTALANVFWSTGEIIGDWYPLVRTKAIINNKKKIRFIYVTCLLYNMTKVCSILFYFIAIPRQVNLPDPADDKLYTLQWWIIVALIQIASFIYDLSIIICLKQNLFSQLNFFKERNNSFIERFKRISEFRIFISMFVTILYLPILITIIIVYVNLLYSNEKIGINEIDYFSVDQIRRALIDVNFVLMYIDQVLLICYVGRRSKPRKSYRKYSLKSKDHSSISFPSFSNTNLLSSSKSVNENLSHHSYHSYHEYHSNGNGYEEEPPLPVNSISSIVETYCKPVNNFYKDTQSSATHQSTNENKYNKYNLNPNYYENENNNKYNYYNNYINYYNTATNDYYMSGNSNHSSSNNNNNSSYKNPSLYPSGCRSKVSNIKIFSYSNY